MEKENTPNAPIASVGAMFDLNEDFPHGIFKLEKFWNGEDNPYEVIEIKNAYVNSGAVLMSALLIGAGGTAFNNANAFLGVGDSTTAFSASQTDLQAATNKLRKAMDATFPSQAGQVTTWKATFTTSDANFHWQEMALFNASTSGTMLNRIVSDMGTKTSAGAWVLSLTLTIP